MWMLIVITREEASTHKSAKMHGGIVVVTLTFDHFTPK